MKTERDDLKLYKVREISDIINVSVWGVYQMICRREIPFIKIGRRIRFDRDEIAKWIDKHRINDSGITTRFICERRR
ncbi:MAG: helix-turn-helix domain-containing protein [Candidatus Brocadiia bacterium]